MSGPASLLSAYVTWLSTKVECGLSHGAWTHHEAGRSSPQEVSWFEQRT